METIVVQDKFTISFDVEKTKEYYAGRQPANLLAWLTGGVQNTLELLTHFG